MAAVLSAFDEVGLAPPQQIGRLQPWLHVFAVAEHDPRPELLTALAVGNQRLFFAFLSLLYRGYRR